MNDLLAFLLLATHIVIGALGFWTGYVVARRSYTAHQEEDHGQGS